MAPTGVLDPPPPEVGVGVGVGVLLVLVVEVGVGVGELEVVVVDDSVVLTEVEDVTGSSGSISEVPENPVLPHPHTVNSEPGVAVVE